MKRYTSIIAIAIVFVLCFATFTTVSANNPIKIVLNGNRVETDVSPQIINGRIMVPVRAITEAIGYEVEWNEKFQAVLIQSKKYSESLKPKPINPVINLEVKGSENFKADIWTAVSLIKEKSPSDYWMLATYVHTIEDKYTTPTNIGKADYENNYININFSAFDFYAQELSSSDRLNYLASVIVHETYHISMLSRMGLTFDALEQEILAHARQRQFLSTVGAPGWLIENVSLDRVLDTNYYEKL